MKPLILLCFSRPHRRIHSRFNLRDLRCPFDFENSQVREEVREQPSEDAAFSVGMKRSMIFNSDAVPPAKVSEILQSAQVDVGRVVPLIRQFLGHRHSAVGEQ